MAKLDAAGRKRAAKKAARTRAANAAALKRWKEVDQPAKQKLEHLINRLLQQGATVDLRWLGDRPLRGKAYYGTLVRFLQGGMLWRVRVEGHKKPRDFHPGFWEVLF
jgi:hypothetical protein